MKSIIKTKPEPGIEIVDREIPAVGDNDILLKVTAAGLCGSDVHIYEWTAGYEWIPMPMIPGHEFAGEVVEIGSKVTGVATGDRITSLPAFTCGECLACASGQPNTCEKQYVLGLGSDGAFSEYMTIKNTADMFKIPDNVTDEMASLTEPLAVGMQGIDLSGIKPGQTAAVFGPGPIGLLTIKLLKTAGAGLIIATGTSADKNRLKLAEVMGADVIINVDQEDPVKKVKEIAGSLDFVFEATGIASTINQGLQMIKRGGKVMVIGIHKDHATFDAIELVRNQKSLIGVYSYERNTWERCLVLMSSGRVDPTSIITHRLPFSKGLEGFELASRKEAAKVVFVPEG